jgi:hypothetical protein
MQRHGRKSQIILELTVSWGIALALGLVMPYPLWQSTGQTGAAVVILAYATAVTAFVTLRRLPQRVEIAAVTQALPDIS